MNGAPFADSRTMSFGRRESYNGQPGCAGRGGIEVMRSDKSSRREFLATARGAGSGLLIASFSSAVPKTPAREEEEVAPAEDLMREHGVLNRVLLIYEEALRRLDAR